MLRVAVGGTAAVEGVSYLARIANGDLAVWTIGLVSILSGVALVIGFFTPVASLVVTLWVLGIAFSWFPASLALAGSRHAQFGMLVTAIAIALLGPGAFSVDGRLFGRREIIIPPGSLQS